MVNPDEYSRIAQGIPIGKPLPLRYNLREERVCPDFLRSQPGDRARQGEIQANRNGQPHLFVGICILVRSRSQLASDDRTSHKFDWFSRVPLGTEGSLPELLRVEVWSPSIHPAVAPPPRVHIRWLEDPKPQVLRLLVLPPFPTIQRRALVCEGYRIRISIP